MSNSGSRGADAGIASSGAGVAAGLAGSVGGICVAASGEGAAVVELRGTGGRSSRRGLKFRLDVGFRLGVVLEL